MGLTSTGTLVAAGALAVALPLYTLLVWNRVRGPRPVRAAQRLALLALVQACAVLVAFLAVNRQYVFFASVQDLVGAPPPAPAIVATGGQRLVGPTGSVKLYRAASQRSADGGRLLTETVHGNLSGVTATVLVHLPPEYDRQPGRRFPVLELFAGWHGGPHSWIHNIHVLDAMRPLRQAGTLQPLITVIPTIDIALPRDTECTDVPHGPQAETWLSSDVRNLVLGQFRALPSPHSWAVMGFSSGGYCAAKLPLHRPDWYATAAVLSGYFDTGRDATTGDLWGGSTRYRQQNSPLWLIGHRPRPAVDVLVFVSKQDRGAWPSAQRFLRAVRPPLQAFALVVPHGGHNLKALRQSMPTVLVWVSSHLAADTARR
jgi:enterochelin esterase-like enzyme